MQLWLCDDGLQAGYSSSQQRRIESDAEDLCLDGRTRRAILLCCSEDENWTRKSLLPRPLQAGNFSLLLGKLVSDADVVVATITVGETIFLRGNEE